MYAVVDIDGHQYRVKQGDTLFVNRLKEEEGKDVTFEKVLLLEDNGKVEVGTPLLKKKVTATVIEHLKGDKVIVFKKKRRKGYKVKRGHRQYLTKIEIKAIG